MKYALIRTYPKDSLSRKQNVVYYTFTILEHLIKINGHELVHESNIDSNTVILVSITTAETVSMLKNIREQYPDNIIITGGHYAYNFHVLQLFSNYVSVGQGFEFFRCNNLDEIERLDSVVRCDDHTKIVIPSELIDWKNVPLALDSKNHYYYWGGVGCQNKCQYCFTSWTNRLQSNSERAVKSAAEYAKIKKKTITITSNEYGYSAGAAVQDMMMKDFLTTPLEIGKPPKLIRLGVEFGSENMRRKTGKYFTDEEFWDAILKAERENKELNLFFIAGLEPLENLEKLLFKYTHNFKKSPKVFIKITNLVYMPYTPLYKKRHEMNYDYYAYPDYRNNLLRVNGNTQRYRFLSIAYPRTAFFNTAISCTTTKEEYDIARRIHNSKDDKEAFNLLHSSGILDHEFSHRIKFWYQK